MEFCYGSRSQLGLVLDWILDFHAKYRDKKTFAAMSFDHVIGKHQRNLRGGAGLFCFFPDVKRICDYFRNLSRNYLVLCPYSLSHRNLTLRIVGQ